MWADKELPLSLRRRAFTFIVRIVKLVLGGLGSGGYLRTDYRDSHRTNRTGFSDYHRAMIAYFYPRQPQINMIFFEKVPLEGGGFRPIFLVKMGFNLN